MSLWVPAVPTPPRGGPSHLWAGRAGRAGAHGADTAGGVVPLEGERAMSRGTGAPTEAPTRVPRAHPSPGERGPSPGPMGPAGAAPSPSSVWRRGGAECEIPEHHPHSPLPPPPSRPALPAVSSSAPCPGVHPRLSLTTPRGPGLLHHLNLQELLFHCAPLKDLRGGRGSVLLGQTGNTQCRARGDPGGQVGPSPGRGCPQRCCGAAPCQGTREAAVTSFQEARES